MNLFIRYLNFIGIVALALLCALQWKTNSQLTAQTIAFQKTIRDQTNTIADQANTLRENASDLNDFRQRLTLAENQIQKAEIERSQLQALRDRLLTAVAARDQVLKDQADSIHKLVDARNGAIAKFNDLVTTYNALISQH